MKLGEYGVLPRTKRPNGNRATLWHMAPEGFKGEMELKSDVWSLGVTLIELAEGQNPYAGCTALKVMRLVCDGQSPALSSSKWSAEFVDFVNKCLVRDVKERWSVSELMEVSDRAMA